MNNFARHRVPLLLLIVAILATAAAAWLSQTGAEPTAAAPAIVRPEPADALQPVVVAMPAESTETGIAPIPEIDTPNETVSASPNTPAEDWLHPTYGLTHPDDIAAIEALQALANSLNFDYFWQVILPLADRDNDFALYLTLALRDFLPLSPAALRFGFVEEPYLEQRRRDFQSPNWLHWLFARWQADWQPDSRQKADALNRALSGHAGAQTLLVSQSAWFTGQPALANQLDELLDRLADNPWLQLRNLTQLSARAVTAAGPDDAALNALLRRLSQAGHPLSHWLADALQTDRTSAEQRRSGLLNLAQDGYITALQEVQALATDARGRWTDSTLTPISLNDAIAVFQQQAINHPDNPIVSVALCELHWHNGDYQASWRYLQKFAYQDAWSDEVEDYTCTRSAPRDYGNRLIALGVITEPEWQQHIDTIDARRARIRQEQ